MLQTPHCRLVFSSDQLQHVSWQQQMHEATHTCRSGYSLPTKPLPLFWCAGVGRLCNNAGTVAFWLMSCLLVTSKSHSVEFGCCCETPWMLQQQSAQCLQVAAGLALTSPNKETIGTQSDATASGETLSCLLWVFSGHLSRRLCKQPAPVSGYTTICLHIREAGDRGYFSQSEQITHDSYDFFMHLDTAISNGKAEKATEIPSSSLHSTSELKDAATETTSGSDTAEKKGDQ